MEKDLGASCVWRGSGKKNEEMYAVDFYKYLILQRVPLILRGFCVERTLQDRGQAEELRNEMVYLRRY